MRSENFCQGASPGLGLLRCAAVWAVLSCGNCALSQNTPSPVAAREVAFASGNLTLHGFLYQGSGTGPLPAILWNHGSERLPGRLPNVAEFFTSRGYVFFVPHRRGQGRSSDAATYVMDVLKQEGDRRGPAARSAKLVEMMEIHLQDQLAALVYLHSLPFVDPKRVAVMGCSFGGIQTLLAAEAAPDIGAAVDFAGAAETWQGSPDLRTRLTKAARNAKVPVFFTQAQGDYDLTPSHELAKQMEKAGKETEVHIYPRFGRTQQENHEFCVHGVDVWGPGVLAFIEKAFAAGQKE